MSGQGYMLYSTIFCQFFQAFYNCRHYFSLAITFHLITYVENTSLDVTGSLVLFIFIYLGFLRHFQHCTGHITTGSWKDRGNQYIEFARVLYCRLPTNGKQLPHKALTGIEPRPQRWEARVLPLCHHGPSENPVISL